MLHLVLLAQHPEARCALFQNERGDRPAVVGDIGPFAEDEDQIGDVATGDEGLASRYAFPVYASGLKAGR